MAAAPVQNSPTDHSFEELFLDYSDFYLAHNQPDENFLFLLFEEELSFRTNYCASLVRCWEEEEYVSIDEFAPIDDCDIIEMLGKACSLI